MDTRRRLHMSASGSVKEKVFAIVAEQLGKNVEDITLESTFIGDLGADSLDLTEMMMALEESFEISIPDDMASEIASVGQAVEFIESNVKK